MALKRLTTAEMVQVSGAWIAEDSAAHKALYSVPELGGLVERVALAHKALHEAQPGLENPRVAAIVREATTVDAEHDGLIRGVHMFLTSLALLAETQDRSDMYAGLLDFLLPNGLDHMQMTYRGEAGAAELLASRIDSDANVKRQLKEIMVGKKPLVHFINAWIEKARRLGELEDERASFAVSAGATSGIKMVFARNGWIRAVNALEAIAGLAELDEETDRIIFGALRLAEKAADRRARTTPEEPWAPPSDSESLS